MEAQYLVYEGYAGLPGVFFTYQYVYEGTFNDSGVLVDVDIVMANALQSQLSEEVQVTDLYDATFLQQVATGYYRQLAAIIVKQLLMGPTSINTTGSVVMNQNRLVVRNWAAQWMAGLVGTCVILTLAGLFIVPRKGVLPRSPSTIYGMVSLLLHSYDLLAGLAYSGVTDEKGLARILRASTFQSGVLRDAISGQV